MSCFERKTEMHILKFKKKKKNSNSAAWLDVDCKESYLSPDGEWLNISTSVKRKQK